MTTTKPMDDRELLELAAKAAGYRKFQYCETSGGSKAIYVDDAGIGFWAPLTDDGDALRLAVKLCIRVACMYGFAHAWTGLREFREAEASDPEAAARRAIVRAAAEIARQEKDHDR